MKRPLFWCTLGLIAALYLLTISRFLPGGDSGELIVTAFKLAVPHPPGYPLYAMLGHLFTFLPISTIAWRMNFFSVVCQLACAALMFQLVHQWLKNQWLAAWATLSFCLAPLVWKFSIEAEVFALNNLFAIVLLWIFFQYQTTRKLHWAYLGCATLGLACTHHLTIVLFSAPFFVTFLVEDWRVLLRPRTFLTGVLLFAFGLAPYALLSSLGENHAMYGWGDLSTMDGFWTHVLRKEYGSFQMAIAGHANASYISKLYYFMREMFIQTTFVGMAICLLTLVRIQKETKAFEFAILLIASLVAYVLIFHGLSNLDLSVPLYYHVQSRMWILPLMLITLLTAWGIQELSQNWTWHRGPYLAGAFLSAVIAAAIGFNWHQVNESNDDFFEQVGHSIIDNVQPGSVVLMREDVYVNAVRFLQAVKGVRPDVHMIPLDVLWWPWMKGKVEGEIPGFQVPGLVMRFQKQNPGEFTVKDLIDANFNRYPLYIAKLLPTEEELLRANYVGFPYGFHTRIKRSGAEFLFTEVEHEITPFLNIKVKPSADYRRESWDEFVYENYFPVKLSIAEMLLRNAQNPIWRSKALEILGGVEGESQAYAPRAAQIRTSLEAAK